MKEKFLVVGSKVLVKTEDAPETIVPGGRIVTPEAARRVPDNGVIILVGPDCKVAQIGDAVMTKQFSGHAVVLEGTNFRVVDESDILVISRGDS